MGSLFITVLQLFLFWTVLDVYVIVIPKVPQTFSVLSIQCFGGLPLHLILCTPPSSAILQISAIINFHNVAKVSQAPLPYPVVYFLL